VPLVPLVPELPAVPALPAVPSADGFISPAAAFGAPASSAAPAAGGVDIFSDAAGMDLPPAPSAS
jgi:hypothetical protein